MKTQAFSLARSFTSCDGVNSTPVKYGKITKSAFRIKKDAIGNENVLFLI